MNPALRVECLWAGNPYQGGVQGLEAYDPVQQLLESVKVNSASLPFTYSLGEDALEGDPFLSFSECCGISTPLGMGVGHSSCEPSSVLCAVAFTPEVPSISFEQQNSLQLLLDKHVDAFSTGKHDIGCVQYVYPIRHRIQVKPEASPVCTTRPLTSFSQHERDFMSSEISMLESLGVIRKSKSPWISSPVCVKKQDKSLRLCIDFRPLNAVTTPDPYPLPVVEHLLNRMSHAVYFSCLDIVSAFWQIPMHPADIKYTGFRTPTGNYEWVRMPFGLVNAPSTFQRLIDEILAGLDFVAVYLDDVFIFSTTWEEHLSHIDIVLERCRRYHLKLKRPNCLMSGALPV
jgi:hypothetical protein